ncbi:MAG: hypothetical protein IIA05_01615 [Proteobacteria bacterium]|nr:hypothetical protein [Pseudomonadota bacterium]
MAYYTGERKRRLTEGVKANAKRDRIPREKNGRWLNRNPLWFNPTISLPEPVTVEGVLNRLLHGQRIYRRDLWIRDLSILLANLIAAERSERPRPVVISLNDNDWHQPAEYEYPTSRVLRLTKYLHDEGLINMKKGSHFEHKGRKTRIWAAPALLADHPELCREVVVRPPAKLVELRAARNRDLTGDAKRRAQRRGGLKLLLYEETPLTRGWRKKLARANAINGDARIAYYDNGVCYELHTAMKAIFIGDFDHYGRLHSCGYRHAQGLSKTDRHTITIDGQPVVELDYSGLHPRMLYAAEGKQYEGDPYSDAIDRIPGGFGWSEEARRRSRPLFKTALLALLDSPSVNTAQSSVNEWLYKHYAESRYLRRLGISKARVLIEAFAKAHSPIAHYFGSDIGMKLMNKDARIALDVVWHFTKRGVPIIPVHDSFIVQDSHAEELWQVMDETYQKHNDGFTCPIKGPWSYNPANRSKLH